MGGMFPSTEDLVFAIPRPQFVEFDTGTGQGSYSLATTDEEITLYVYKPDGTALYSGALSDVSGTVSLISKATHVVITIAVAEFIDGEWTAALDETASTPGSTVPMVAAQWGGWIDTVVNGATQCLPGGDMYDSVDDIHVTTQTGGDLLVAAQNADSQSYRIQQAQQGDSTFDSGTGIVRTTSTAEEFTLADEGGTPVTSMALAVRRINSTLG